MKEETAEGCRYMGEYKETKGNTGPHDGYCFHIPVVELQSFYRQEDFKEGFEE